MRLLILIIVVSIIVFIASIPAIAKKNAEFIYTKTDLFDGFWQYEFTFKNNSTRGECLNDVKIAFFDPDVFGFTLPAGWKSVLWEGWHVTDYVRTRTSKACGIPAGSLLSGFNFKANYNFPELFFRADFDGRGKESRLRGTAELISVAVAPEPVSFILFIIGGVTLGLSRFCIKKIPTRLPII